MNRDICDHWYFIQNRACQNYVGMVESGEVSLLVAMADDEHHSSVSYTVIPLPFEMVFADSQ
jgi:hypothetical protein